MNLHQGIENTLLILNHRLQNQITITTATLNSQEVVIQITDNGVGMSEAVKPRIFEQFYTTKVIGRGAGLGLSVAQQVIEEQHNGQQIDIIRHVVLLLWNSTPAHIPKSCSRSRGK